MGGIESGPSTLLSVNEYPEVLDDSEAFMLSEFGELGQFWRHTDGRIENGINYYLTASAAVTSVIALGSQQISDARVFAGLVVLVVITLIAGGYILIRRIVSAALIKAEYTMALNTIRRYFSDKHPQISPYLVLPMVQDLPEENGTSLADFKVRMPGYILRALQIWTGGLFGIAVGILSWIVEPQFYVASLAVIGALAGTACYGYLTWRAKSQVVGYRERLARRR